MVKTKPGKAQKAKHNLARGPQLAVCMGYYQGCSSRDLGLDLESARDQFFYLGIGLESGGLGLENFGLGLGLGLEGLISDFFRDQL